MAQRKRYDANANVIGTAVGCADLAAFPKADLRALASLARALAARAEAEICARRPSFPSSLPPQLVLAWLPLREAGPAPHRRASRSSGFWRKAAGSNGALIFHGARSCGAPGSVSLSLDRGRVSRLIEDWQKGLGSTRRGPQD